LSPVHRRVDTEETAAGAVRSRFRDVWNNGDAHKNVCNRGNTGAQQGFRLRCLIDPLNHQMVKNALPPHSKAQGQVNRRRL